ncbi:MAG TPA: deaminase [Gammaproteobacteria bacterium]|jgi:tRNA(adenine34) deaminase|nr:deaminase [Gammaproteobacteria bacterium]
MSSAHPSLISNELTPWIQCIEKRLNDFTASHSSLTQWGRAYCEAVALAIKAAKLGNFGVGAVLCDTDGTMLAYGHNEVFVPYARSDAHAEMMTMDQFEKEWRVSHSDVDITTLTLITTLEPCIMCTGRLLISAVNQIKYMSPDHNHGATSIVKHLPETYACFSDKTNFSLASDCPPELRQLAHDVFFMHPLFEKQLSNHGAEL